MNIKHLHKNIVTSFLILLIVLIIQSTIIPIKVFAFEKESSFDLTQDDFNKKLREGKDLMDKEDWQNAIKVFSELTNKYPKNKSADAAFYWLAFCYKKTGKFNEAISTIDYLLKDFPKSSWFSDAQVLRLEVIKLVGNYEELSKSYQNLSETLDKDAKKLPTPTSSDGSFESALAREDEMRLAAFQVILESDPQRAIGLIDSILEETKSSDSLKRSLLRSLSGLQLSTKDTTSIVKIREMLIKHFQTESKYLIKTEIIYALIILGDKESSDNLLKIYFANQDKEIKKFIIRAYGKNVFTPRRISNLAEFEVNKFENLFNIFQNEKDPELKHFALLNLNRTKDWQSQPTALKTLFQTYETETDVALKVEIIRTLALSKEKEAINKLMSIAKNDEDKGMRIESIRLLNTIKTPEVIKFLDDMIKGN